MSWDRGPGEDALQKLVRDEAAGLLAEALSASRRDALEILRARLTAAMVEEVERLAGSGRPEDLMSPRTAAAEARPAAAPAPAQAVPVSAEPLAGWYVYGLTWDAVARTLDIPAGVDDAPVEVVTAGAIAALVSPMTNTELWGMSGEGDVDLELLAPRARRHEWVLEQMLERGGVLPLRFGVLCPSLGPLRDLLRESAEAFEQALHRLENHFEWGLTVSAEEAGAPRPLAAVATGTDSGRDYLARRREDRAAGEERARQTSQAAAFLHDTLAGLSADARVHATTRAAPGQGRVVLRASYLVPSAEAEAFRAAAERGLSSAPADLRLTGELTGPWPPYHFCDLTLDGVTA